MKSYPPQIEGSRAGLAFLLAEIESGLTLVSIASSVDPREHEKTVRLVGKARAAYEAVLRFRGRVEFENRAAATDFETRLARLRTALQRFDI